MKFAALLLLFAATFSTKSWVPHICPVLVDVGSRADVASRANAGIRVPHSDSAPLLGGIRVGIAQSAIQAPAAVAHTYRYIRVGAPDNITVHPRAGYALMGGGTDLDEAFRWLCDRADGGDFLILRAHGDDDYNPYVQGLCHLNSVATLILTDRASSTNQFVIDTITNASAIFIAGGDQARYINFWAGTPVEAALRQAVKNGVPIGGTSAGLAVLGQYIYSAQNDKPDDKDLSSDEALADPFYRQVAIARDLFGIPILRGIITDTHFDTRHREGRLLAFMARILASGQAKTIRAIGVDERNCSLSRSRRSRAGGGEEGWRSRLLRSLRQTTAM